MYSGRGCGAPRRRTRIPAPVADRSKGTPESSSVAHRRRAFLTGELVACEAIEGESLDQGMIAPRRHGMTHGLAAHRRRLEAPGAPSGIQKEALDRRHAHDGREVRRHVGEPRPLAVYLYFAPAQEHVQHMRSPTLDVNQRLARCIDILRI